MMLLPIDSFKQFKLMCSGTSQYVAGALKAHRSALRHSILISMRHLLRSVLAALAIASLVGKAESAPPPTDEMSVQTVALVTFGPGDYYWERFGHNAIVAGANSVSKRLAYNYGVFDFQESHFLVNFARGRMHYSLAAEPINDDIERYVAEGRSVTVQMLNLTPAQAAEVTSFLTWNAQPQNATYPYDYFLNNCSTKLRDVLNSALGGELERQLASQPASRTYRFDGIRLMSPVFWFALGLDMALGPRADRPLNRWQESFVPMELSSALDSVVVRDAQGKLLPLVSQKEVVFPGSLPSAPAAPVDFIRPFLAIGLGLAAALFCLARTALRRYRMTFRLVAIAWWMFCGLSGLLLAGLWILSDHRAAWENENLLLLNPLCLALAWAWWRAPRTARYLASLIAASTLVELIVRTLPGWYQSNLEFVALTLPAHVTLAALAWFRGTGADPSSRPVIA
jgi:hypothetical protein